MWWERAACASPYVDPEWFFPTPPSDVGRAKAVCSRCPVVDRCRKAADDAEGDAGISRRWGVWGGSDPYERLVEHRGVVHGSGRAWDAGCRCDVCSAEHDARRPDLAWVAS